MPLAKRKKPQTGDVIRIPITPETWLFGRVVSTKAHAGAGDFWSDCILLYVFRHVSSTGVPPRPLLATDLLFPPVISSHELWKARRCELVENRPFEPGEVLAQHCFENPIWTPPRYFDELGRQLPGRVEPCGLQAMTTLLGIEVSIQEALQLSSLFAPPPVQPPARKPGRRKKPPTRIALDPDFSHAEHVGHTQDGRQFFFTNPYQPNSDGNDGREFLALYLFDRKGILLDAQIDDLGKRSTLDFVRVEALRNERLRSLGKVKHARITMAPFSVERFGTTFGLVAQEDDDGGWTVVIQPGGSMVFIPPWDSGIYDT